MKQRDQRTIAGNKEKSQRRAPRAVARLRSRSYVFGVALLVHLLAIHAFATSTLAQNLLWAKRAGGTGNEICSELDTGNHRCSGIAVDGSGNSYLTGSFGLMATFGVGEANETLLIGAANTNIFVAKYNSDGTLAWAKQVFVAKYNSNGTLAWVRGIGSTDSGNKATQNASCNTPGCF